jgi:hypothetical protein
MTNTIKPIPSAELDTVTGGAGMGESISNAWQGTKNFAGGATAGLLHGAGARNSQVETFANTSSRATKAGFEMGAAVNMGAGPVGDAVGWGMDVINPAKEK